MNLKEMNLNMMQMMIDDRSMICKTNARQDSPNLHFCTYKLSNAGPLPSQSPTYPQVPSRSKVVRGAVSTAKWPKVNCPKMAPARQAVLVAATEALQ